MGTRHMIGAVKGGKWVLGQYGQWDGYLDGQGAQTVDFFMNQYDRDKFAKGVEHVTFHEDAFWEELGPKLDAMPENEWKAKYPQLSRDTGAKIWEIIQNLTEDAPFQDRHGFGENDVFCEWAYVFDMDNEELEIYCSYDLEHYQHQNKPSRFENKKQLLIAVKKISELTDKTLKEVEESMNKDPLLEAAERAVSGK